MAIFHEIRGLARECRKDLAGAIEDFTQAMILQPHQSEVHAHRGWAYLVSGAAQLALDDFEKAIQDDTSNGDAYYGRGSALVALGKYKEAVVEAEDALHHGEPTPRMLYVAARIYAQAADLAITKASRRHPGIAKNLLPVHGSRPGAAPPGAGETPRQAAGIILAGRHPGGPHSPRDPSPR